MFSLIMNIQFNFIDLFSGIGGFHQGCVKNGGKCIGACEINELARKIYEDNYGIIPHDDIKTLKSIKNIDLLCAGFPCQSHSSLGHRKGLRDSRGKLFDILKKYIYDNEPKVFLLENVKGLLSSNSGRSFKHIIESLEDIGYTVSWAVLDSKNFGVPQHRERIYIVGHKTKLFNFTNLLKYKKTKTIKDIIDINPSKDLYCDIFSPNDIFKKPVVTNIGFVLRAKLSNFTNRKLFSSNGIVGTIPTSSPPPIYDENIQKQRHLSITELKKCQGFPVSFKFPKNISRSVVVYYIGNSVTVNVISAIAKEIVKELL
jgi:DNA (cytosine-5)-methyltransferase 1